MKMCCFILKIALTHVVAIVALTLSGVFASRVESSLLSLLHECVESSGVNVISQDRANPIPNIIQNNSSYRAVMFCIEQRRQELQHSNDPVWWYIGHVFQLNKALELQLFFVKLHERGQKLDCVEPLAEPPTFLSRCVKITERYLLPVKNYVQSNVGEKKSDLMITLCRRIGYAMANTCGFENALYKCGVKDGSNSFVATFLGLFFANPCDTVSASGFDPKPQVLSCIQDYKDGYHLRFKKLHKWIHLSELASYLTTEMETICRHIPGALSCAKDAVVTSEINLDKVTKKFLSNGNLNRLAEYACSKFVPAFKANAACVLDVYQYMVINSANACLTDTGEEFYYAFHDWTFMSIYNEPSKLCRKLQMCQTCFQPIFSSCSKGLDNIFATFMDYFAKSCEDPSTAWLRNTASYVGPSLALTSIICVFIQLF